MTIMTKLYVFVIYLKVDLFDKDEPDRFQISLYSLIGVFL
jgi:hypothetical protein